MYEQRYKILVFIPNLGTGGAERVVVNLLGGLDRKRFDLYLVVVEMKESVFLEQLPPDVELINFNKSNVRFAIAPLARLIRNLNPDLILSNMSHANIAAWLALKLSRATAKIIMVEHGIISKEFTVSISSMLKYLMKFVYPRSDKVVAVSSGTANDLSISLKLNRQKIDVIYNPIVFPEIEPYSKEIIDDPFLIDKKFLYIVSVGSLKLAKDYPTLLKAFRIVRDELDINLLILGDGPLRMELTILAKKLNLSNNVYFLGVQRNPFKYMRNARLLVLSSEWESFGNVVVEAMACECPVVSTDCIGPREILAGGEFGLLTPVGDPKDLAQSILRVLTQPELAEKLITQGKKRSSDFSVDKIARNYEDLFYNVLSEESTSINA